MFTSIRNQLIVGYLTLVVVLIVIGCTTWKTNNDLGSLAADLYDKNATGMSHAREALIGFVRFEARHPGAIATPLDASARGEINGLLANLDSAIAQATTAKTRALATETRAKLLILGDASGNKPPLGEIDDGLSRTVRQFASDQASYRAQADELIEYSHRQWLMLIAGAVGLASLIFFGISRAILSPLNRAAAIASTIAQGSLNNRIAIAGPNETSQLLRALAKVQRSILDNIKQVAADKLES